MKVKFVIFSAVVLCLSCKGQQEELTYPLVYKSPKGGIVDMIRYKGNYTLNEILTLNQDSTYVYKMCAQLEKGRWVGRNDTIFLYCESRRFHIDSLNYEKKYYKGTICPELPYAWVIKNSKIENVFDKTVLLKE